MQSFILTKKPDRYFLLVFLALIGINPAFPQVLADPQKEREQIFTARIKQFNEFVDRFNLKSDFNGNPADSAFIAKMPRERMVHLLFDLKDPRIQNSGPDYSKDYIMTKEAFISDVVQNNLMLYKYSQGIIAEAKSRVIFNGEPRKIRLFLIQETVGDDMVKWVLYSAKGDILDIFKADTSMVRFIPPSSNETDFINLKRALKDSDHLQYYAVKDYKPDNLTLFFSFIKTGMMKFEYVEEVVYHIIDIPGWYFKVKDFNRNELNSGWLITDVDRNSNSIADLINKIE
jgi:hypothetical protein